MQVADPTISLRESQWSHHRLTYIYRNNAIYNINIGSSWLWLKLCRPVVGMRAWQLPHFLASFVCLQRRGLKIAMEGSNRNIRRNVRYWGRAGQNKPLGNPIRNTMNMHEQNEHTICSGWFQGNTVKRVQVDHATWKWNEFRRFNQQTATVKERSYMETVARIYSVTQLAAACSLQFAVLTPPAAPLSSHTCSVFPWFIPKCQGVCFSRETEYSSCRKSLVLPSKDGCSLPLHLESCMGSRFPKLQLVCCLWIFLATRNARSALRNPIIVWW